MRILKFLFIIFFVTACNTSTKNKEESKDSTLQNDTRVLPPQPVTTDTIFRGFGNEPFWSVYVINNDKIFYHPADGADISVPYVSPSSPDVLTTKYFSSNDSIAMELTIKKANCSDGMSDITHPYEVTLLINAMRLSGCGRDR